MHELRITLSDAGCSVEGPITDKFLCYAMLELAKDAIRDAANKPESVMTKPPMIVPATPGLRVT